MSVVYDVRARRWDHGWELYISGPDGKIGVSQCTRLIRAERQAQDFLATRFDGESKDYTVRVKADLGGIEKEVAAVREETAAAAAAQQAAAEHTRAVVAKLLTIGLSLAESALVLGLSRARAQQLAVGARMVIGAERAAAVNPPAIGSRPDRRL